MNKQRIEELYNFYKDTLLNDCMPFWQKNCLDRDYGGILTCFDQKGTVYNTDKSVWFQGRALWLFSKLYNEVEKREEWIEIAESSYKFIHDYCFDADGRMFFTVTKDGRELQKRRYFFSEAFACIGMAEYSKAAGDEDIFKRTLEIYERIMYMYRQPESNPPKINPQNRKVKSHSLPMILLATTQSLRDVHYLKNFDEITDELVNEVITHFLHPREKALFETVGLNGERLDSPQGRCVNPGHAIETSWFIMHEGVYRQNQYLIDKGLEILEYSMELGWDRVHGGLFYFVDVEGKPAEQLEWDMKLWWPHTEALYALLLAYILTDNNKFIRYYEMVHEWVFSHFPDKNYGEWFGYLHRDGTVSNTLKGSLWKGPFHLPRALFQSMKLCEAELKKFAVALKENQNCLKTGDERCFQ